MTHLVEVAFKGNRKEFFLWDGEEIPSPRSPVIVEVDRGEDLGRVHAVGDLAEKRCTGCAHGCGAEPPRRRMLRTATEDDEKRAAGLRTQDDESRRRAMERVKAHGLVMKVSDAEWQWDRKKLTLYFTAERRVDFRALVRDLASTFRTRIELKQIGVRDEAKRLGGIGRCGREYCSASWLPELRPVNLQVAKDQRLSLNPSQISGACGRLMCCLRYEHEFYVQSRKRFPKEGKILVTANGEEQVVANDIFGDRVTLRDSEGDTRIVPLAELRAGMERRATPPPTHHPPGQENERDDTSSEPLPYNGMSDADDDEVTRTPEGTAAGTGATAGHELKQPERRPHRSRGRRGGRRNRPSGPSTGATGPRTETDGDAESGADAEHDPPHDD